jgi:hypothetical protein
VVEIIYQNFPKSYPFTYKNGVEPLLVTFLHPYKVTLYSLLFTSPFKQNPFSEEVIRLISANESKNLSLYRCATIWFTIQQSLY